MNYKEAIEYNKETLNTIEQQVQALQNKGWGIIICGDMNGHVGLRIPGNNKDINSTGRAITQFIDQNNLQLINGTDICKGTWTW